MADEQAPEGFDEAPYPPVTTCPKCGGATQPYTVEGVSLDRCGECGGLWFDEGELEALLALDHRAVIDQRHTTRTPTDLDGQHVTCPRCGGMLIKMHPLARPGITVDACVVCYGTWLDAGEAEALQSHGWLARIRDLLHQAFRKG